MSAVMRGAVPVVCNMLAGTLGVKVVWGDFHTASTDGKVVKLPNLPLEGKDVGRWVYGYVAHEAGHIRETDFRMWPGHDPMLKDIANILEDPRIERVMCVRYPGVRAWLADLTDALLGAGKLGIIDADDPPARQVRKWLMYCTGYEMMGYDCLQQMAAQQSRLMAQIFAPDQFAELLAGVQDAQTARSTAEVIAAAARIVKVLKEADPPREEPSPDEAGDEGEQQSRQQPARSEGVAVQDVQGDNVAVATPEQLRGLRAALATVAHPGQWGVDPTDKGGMVEEHLADVIDEARRAACHGGRHVRMPAVFVDRARVDGCAAIASIRRESTAIRARLEELVQDATATLHSPARAGRRLLRDAGVRMMCGNLRAFDRRSGGLDVDAAVHLLQDVSTSMRLRLGAANAATTALCVSFADIEGVDTAVSAFPYPVPTLGGVDHEGVRLLKAFDEDYRDAAGRIASLQVNGDTPLANALLHSHQLLLERRRERRIALVVTDGQPDSVDEALQVVRAGRLAGIEHFGIGIGVDLGHLFGTFVRIETVADLTRQVVQLVRDALFDREQLQAP
jgi:hypothetical protein